MSNNKLQVVLLDEAIEFIQSLPLKVQKKIAYNYLKIEQGIIDNELFKKLENSNIWEFRTIFSGNCYRLFSFWDTETETLVIATHGIVKKTQKTPPIEKSILRRKKKNDMAQMHLTPLSKLVDDVWGEKGTEERDAMEKQLKEEVNAYYLGEAIRKARQAQKLTQEELGERIGVQRAQISRLEKGHTIMTLPTLSRVFRALGVASATLDLGAAGKVALW